MRRVVILGPGASGKSTLAIQLSSIAGLPVIELDKLFWRPGLVATPHDQWVKVQERLIQENGWIIDGDLRTYDAVEVRLRAADTIIFLDFDASEFAHFPVTLTMSNWTMQLCDLNQSKLPLCGHSGSLNT